MNIFWDHLTKEAKLKLLQKLVPAKGTAAIAHGLMDADGEVRAEAMRLALFHWEEFKIQILQGLADTNPEVRLYAIRALNAAPVVEVATESIARWRDAELSLEHIEAYDKVLAKR